MKRVAEASEPPIVIPVIAVVAVDVDVALVIPAVERGNIVQKTIRVTAP